MKKNQLWMGFEIQTSSGSVLQPTQVTHWKDQQFKNNQPEAPFHYKADALAGLSLLLLNQNSQNPFSSPSVNFPFVNQCWLALEPHHEMHQRCQSRIQVIKKFVKPSAAPAITGFEDAFTEVLSTSVSAQGVDLAELTALIPHIDVLEKKLSHALLYNFNIQFSRKTAQTLLHLHSFLFSLRTLIAMDYNAYVQDPTFEALKVDSISDYLPKSEYVVNDAILYYKFSKLSAHMPQNVVSEMVKAFVDYSHNATCLVESLPAGFLKSVSAEHLDDTLYLAQMDWLLGTDAGLLFRIREELYGLLEGYEKIFWFDLDGKAHQPAHNLSVNCQITEKDLPTSAAA